MKLKRRVEELSQPQLGSSIADSDGALARDQEDLLADALIDGQDIPEGLTEESLQLKNLLLTAKGQLTDEYGFYVQRREIETQQMIDLTQLGPEVRCFENDCQRELILTVRICSHAGKWMCVVVFIRRTPNYLTVLFKICIKIRYVLSYPV